jgi:hypothetical protein
MLDGTMNFNEFDSDVLLMVIDILYRWNPRSLGVITQVSTVFARLKATQLKEQPLPKGYLFDACRANDLREVIVHLLHGTGPDDTQGQVFNEYDSEITPLLIVLFDVRRYTCLTRKSLRIAMFLVLRGANVHHIHAGNSLIMHAVRWDALGFVKVLVDRGAKYNDVNRVGMTPLMIAASCGHYEVAKYLIQQKVDVKVRNDKNQMALDLASTDALRNLLVSVR